MVRKWLLMLLACTVAGLGLVFAAEKGTPEQAKAMVEQAIGYLNEHGVEQTLAELNKRDGMFVKGDLYVFAYDMEGPIVAHPFIPSLIGQNLLQQPDSKGKLTGNWSKWFGRYRRKIIGIVNPRKDFHSFRHTFIDACRVAQIMEEVRYSITGHTSKEVGGTYGSHGVPLDVKAEAIGRISYGDTVESLLKEIRR